MRARGESWAVPRTEEVMEKLDMFQARFRKLDEFGWWYMDIIQTDDGTQFTSN